MLVGVLGDTPAGEERREKGEKRRENGEERGRGMLIWGLGVCVWVGGGLLQPGDVVPGRERLGRCLGQLQHHKEEAVVSEKK